MNPMERALSERSDDLTDPLLDIGFSAEEADRFVVTAGPALLASYEWQADILGPSLLARPGVARDLLAGIHGRRLALQLGLPEAKTWAGLREFVPAVLRAQRAPEGRRRGGSAPTSPARYPANGRPRRDGDHPFFAPSGGERH